MLVRKAQGVQGLTPDAADKLKVVVWSAGITPSPAATRIRLLAVLGAERMGRLISKVRNYGRGKRRRVEIIASSRDARLQVHGLLRASPLGMQREQAVLGRTYEERKADRLAQGSCASSGGSCAVSEKNKTQRPWSGRACPLSVGTFNASGLGVQALVTVRELSLVGLGLVAITETHLTAEAQEPCGSGFCFLGRPMQAGTGWGTTVEPDSHGVGFLVHNKLRRLAVPLTSQPKFQDAFWLLFPANTDVRVPTARKGDSRSGSRAGTAVVRLPKPLMACVLYLAPRLDRADESGVLADALSELDEYLGRAESLGAEVVVMGDLNCNLRALDDPLRDRRCKDVTSRERALWDIMRRHDLVSLHSLAPAVDYRTLMRHGKGVSMVDYIIASRSVAERCGVLAVHKRRDFNSDHWLVSSVIRRFLVDAPQCLTPTQHPGVRGGDAPCGTKPVGVVPRSHPGWNLAKLRELSNAEAAVCGVSAGVNEGTPAAEAVPAGAAEAQDLEMKAEKLRAACGVSAGADEGTPAAEAVPAGAAEAQDLETKAEKLRALFSARVEGWKGQLSEGSASVAYGSWSALLEETVTEVLGAPRTVKARAQRVMPTWVSDQVWQAIRKRKSSYDKLQRAVSASLDQTVVDELWDTYILHKREAQGACVLAKREFWAQFIDSLNGSGLSTKEFWRGLNRALGRGQAHRWGAIQDGRGGLVEPGDPGYLPLWRDYFRALGNPKPQEELPAAVRARRDAITQAVADPSFVVSPLHPSEAVQKLNAPLSESEVAGVLRSLPAGKAAGPDGFANEILKAVGASGLFPILGRLWEDEVHPDQWNLSTIVPLPKGGDASQLGNTRGISLMSHVCKLYGSILNQRLVEYMEGQRKLVPEQGGFRPGKGCSDHIFVLHEVLARRRLENKATYLMFVDMSKAYDRVWRAGLLYKLAELGVKGKMLRVLQELYRRTTAVVRVNGESSDEFELEVGVRQGDVLSPLLFDAFINDLVSPLKKAGGGVSVPGGATVRESPFCAQLDKFFALLWADDVVFVGETVDQLRLALRVLDDWCQTWGMAVNAAKCGLMEVSPCPLAATTLAQEVEREPFAVQGERIPVVTVYKYLGVHLTPDLLWTTEIHERTKKVRDAIFAHARVLRNPSLAVSVRRHVLVTKILPVALYASEFWGTDVKACAPVEAMVATAYRMVLGASKVALQGPGVGAWLGADPPCCEAAKSVPLPEAGAGKQQHGPQMVRNPFGSETPGGHKVLVVEEKVCARGSDTGRDGG